MSQLQATAPPLPNNHARIAMIVVGILLVAVAACFYWFDPAQYSLFPRCTFHQLTGWHCPGCGGQRAAHHMLHGELAAAFRSNALLLLMLGVGMWYLARHLWWRWTGRQWFSLFQHRHSGWVLAGLVIGFAIARNFPIFYWLAP